MKDEANSCYLPLGDRECGGITRNRIVSGQKVFVYEGNSRRVGVLRECFKDPRT